MKNLLISDHLELDTVLDELFAAFELGDEREIYQKLDFFWARLAMHIRAENLHLFPSVLRAARNRPPAETGASGPSLEVVRESIQHLENDHNFFMRELAAAIKTMYGMSEGEGQSHSEKLAVLRDKLLAMRERLKEHNEIEESYVYLWGEFMNPAELPTLESKINKELENLPPRFRKLERAKES